MKFLMRLNARITANSGILKKPEGDVHPEDVTGKTIQQDHDAIKNLMKVWTVSGPALSGTLTMKAIVNC